MSKLISKPNFVKKLKGGGYPEPTVDEIGRILFGDNRWKTMGLNKKQRDSLLRLYRGSQELRNLYDAKLLERYNPENTITPSYNPLYTNLNNDNNNYNPMPITNGVNDGKTPELVEQESFNRVRSSSMRARYVDNYSNRPDLFDAGSNWDKKVASALNNEFGDLYLLEELIKSSPVLRLQLIEFNNNNGLNISYGSKVKHTGSDGYYDSLIPLANENYGTNFKTRADVAAFQEMMGASKVDGIIGPETEALLDAYYKSTGKAINGRKMYANEGNTDVYWNTLNTLIGGDLYLDEETYSFGNDNYAIDTWGRKENGRNILPVLASYAPRYSFGHINPYTKYILRLMQSYKANLVGPKELKDLYLFDRFSNI